MNASAVIQWNPPTCACVLHQDRNGTPIDTAATFRCSKHAQITDHRELHKAVIRECQRSQLGKNGVVEHG